MKRVKSNIYIFIKQEQTYSGSEKHKLKTGTLKKFSFILAGFFPHEMSTLWLEERAGCSCKTSLSYFSGG